MAFFSIARQKTLSFLKGAGQEQQGDIMNEEPLSYEKWVEEALRVVIKRALEQTVLNGLLGDHHFFITFLTGHADVEIPAHLRVEHPEEMTIVLQHQFNDLDVNDVGFSVSLSFGGRLCHLQIPYSAIVTFADPAVNFVLQLKMAEKDFEVTENTSVSSGNATVVGLLSELPEPEGKEAQISMDDDDDKRDDKMGEVIALDTFRKK